MLVYPCLQVPSNSVADRYLSPKRYRTIERYKRATTRLDVLQRYRSKSPFDRAVPTSLRVHTQSVDTAHDIQLMSIVVLPVVDRLCPLAPSAFPVHSPKTKLRVPATDNHLLGPRATTTMTRTACPHRHHQALESPATVPTKKTTRDPSLVVAASSSHHVPYPADPTRATRKTANLLGSIASSVQPHQYHRTRANDLSGTVRPCLPSTAPARPTNDPIIHERRLEPP